MRFCLKISLRPHSGGFATEHYGWLPVKTEDTQEYFCALFGHLDNLEEKAQKRLNHKETVFCKSGRYVLVNFDKRTQTVELNTDSFNLLGAMYYLDQDCLQVFNDFSLLKEAMQPSDVCTEACLDLLILGYIRHPSTLHKKVKMCFSNTIYFDQSVSRWIEKKSEDIIDCSYDKIKSLANETNCTYTTLGVATEKLIKKWNPTVFRISGGVDTRLMSGLLKSRKELLQNITLQVLNRSTVVESEDRDVIGAKFVANYLEMPLQIITLDENEFAYFARVDQSVGALSGLYGGEILGGVCLSDEIGIFDQDKSFSFYKENFSLNLSILEDHKNSVVDFESTKSSLFRRIFSLITSFRSTIYGSVNWGWAEPYRLNQRALSPFVDSAFLESILRRSEMELTGYKLYRSVGRNMPNELKTFPFSSPIASFYPEEFKEFTYGKNPKDAVFKSENPSRKVRIHPFLSDFLPKHVSPEITSPVFFLRVQNLSNFLYERGIGL